MNSCRYCKYSINKGIIFDSFFCTKEELQRREKINPVTCNIDIKKTIIINCEEARERSVGFLQPYFSIEECPFYVKQDTKEKQKNKTKLNLLFDKLGIIYYVPEIPKELEKKTDEVTEVQAEEVQEKIIKEEKKRDSSHPETEKEKEERIKETREMILDITSGNSIIEYGYYSSDGIKEALCELINQNYLDVSITMNQISIFLSEKGKKEIKEQTKRQNGLKNEK